MFDEGVFDEPRRPLNRQCTQDLDNLVCQLTTPTLKLTRQSESLDIPRDPPERDLTPASTELSIDMKDKCLISPAKDKKSAKKNWKRRILERNKNQGKNGSVRFEDSIDLSFDQLQTPEMTEFSFDSTSSRSPSSLRNSQVSFVCESSLDASDIDSSTETRMSSVRKIDDASDHDEQSDIFFSAKKDKESKRQKLKRIITRPLRRSQSACCENEIPSHALFLDTKNSKSKDTMENRALDLFLYQKLFGNHDDDEKARRFHKTCSAESALAENYQAKSKSSNLAKNMKKKFQFLRRQNTDSVVDHESSFPFCNTTTYDQAMQWSKSLEDLLRDKNGVELFLLFLRSEFSEENLEFWISCEEFRTCNESSMPVMAQKIYQEFVVSKAPKEVNLDADTRTETIENLENLSRDTFDAPQHKIQALMAKDSYPRFLESDLYQYLMENVSKA
ncbi:regulator of G-protein signalling 3 [Mytilus galloprovincialis]|uniref:Regulator of G-protein signalling 3 n=1 Tax=Mytilus galloprovincialis TaxID=29158 RepID=A0A8B6GFU6_MYTGA|nr:regulator of G-protein signalling 3 [Mytilus galloprovincialis]